MKLGLMLPQMGPWASPEALAGAAAMAEEAGFDSVWVLDRLLAPLEPRTPYPGSPDGRLPEAMDILYEPLTTLAWLAARTTRVKLGTGVLVSAFRSPALLGRITASLDSLSGGRLICGLGMGWSEDEYLASGVDFRAKGPRFDEYLQALKAVWTQAAAEFEGRYYSIPRSRMGPSPAQRPHPELWVGGDSAPAVRRAARYGTGWYASGYLPLPEMARKIETLREHLKEEGREGQPFRVGLWTPLALAPEPGPLPLVGPAEHVAEGIREYGRLGVDTVVVAVGMMPGSDAAADLERFSAEVLPQFRQG